MADWQNLNVQFDPAMLQLLNLILAFIMIGIALEIDWRELKYVLLKPKLVFLGFFTQVVMLPGLTVLLCLAFDLNPVISMGMLIVASCPGGSVSNLLTYLSKGNIPLSVTLTSLSTMSAVFLTPFNIKFWGGIAGLEQGMPAGIELSFWDMAQTLIYIVVIPIVVSQIVKAKVAEIPKVINKFFKIFSTLFLTLFVVGALIAHWDVFSKLIGHVFGIVLLHNFLALSTGNLMGRLTRQEAHNIRTLTIETGIQNSGLALLLIFQFFDGLGGLAIIAAAWGVWHAISGGALALYWNSKLKKEAAIMKKSSQLAQEAI